MDRCVCVCTCVWRMGLSVPQSLSEMSPRSRCYHESQRGARNHGDKAVRAARARHTGVYVVGGWWKREQESRGPPCRLQESKIDGRRLGTVHAEV